MEPRRTFITIIAVLIVVGLLIGGAVVNWAFGQGGGGASGSVTVSIHGFAFDPQNLTVAPGTTVKWANGDSVAHYIASLPGAPAAIDSGTIESGSSFSYSFSVPGTYPYYCKIHAYMRGNITVTGSGNSAVVYLSAHNIAFNLTTITVPAGSNVTVHFENLDAGTPHNFAVYLNSSATSAIFQGAIITGVSSTTYIFKAPSTPGTYFFRCDVHPTMMTGSFVVQ